MKRLLLFSTAFAFCLFGLGQAPESFSYHVLIHDAAGEAVAVHAVSLKISILTGSAYDKVIYSESHHVATDQQGLVSLDIGNGTDKTGDLSSIDWSTGEYFLKIGIDTAGGANYKDLGTTQILNVPYTTPVESLKKPARTVSEDKLFISRRYVGNFLDYRQTGPDTYNGPNLIWIKTSMENTLGKISAYGKKCEFSVGDKLYLKRKYYSPGQVSGYWEYQIENDSSIYYKATEFQYDRKVYIETWFK
jgi:hypothetical protein